MVAKRLGMEFYDKELIDAAAKEIGFPAGDGGGEGAAAHQQRAL